MAKAGHIQRREDRAGVTGDAVFLHERPEVGLERLTGRCNQTQRHDQRDERRPG